MIYVPEVLKARLEDNMLQLKYYRVRLVSLENQILNEPDSKARQGMLNEQNDIYYEYESLSKENEEIKVVLRLIENYDNRQKRKEPPCLSAKRLSYYESNQNALSL